MPDCPKCGAPTRLKPLAVGGQIAVDATETAWGDHRFVEIDGVLRPCRENYSERAYRDHAATCGQPPAA